MTVLFVPVSNFLVPYVGDNLFLQALAMIILTYVWFLTTFGIPRLLHQHIDAIGEYNENIDYNKFSNGYNNLKFGKVKVEDAIFPRYALTIHLDNLLIYNDGFLYKVPKNVKKDIKSKIEQGNRNYNQLRENEFSNVLNKYK